MSNSRSFEMTAVRSWHTIVYVVRSAFGVGCPGSTSTVRVAWKTTSTVLLEAAAADPIGVAVAGCGPERSRRDGRSAPKPAPKTLAMGSPTSCGTSSSSPSPGARRLLGPPGGDSSVDAAATKVSRAHALAEVMRSEWASTTRHGTPRFSTMASRASTAVRAHRSLAASARRQSRWHATERTTARPVAPRATTARPWRVSCWTSSVAPWKSSTAAWYVA
mmetsp:Transcript_5304/g.21896  ORF Transcript_5304/g.21896 Transcript_5304/m.21896 type:complete len:219 (+) Transcript_5304:1626-2282(+)